MLTINKYLYLINYFVGIGLQVQHSETKFSNLSKPHSEKNLRKHQNGEAMSVHFAPTQRKGLDFNLLQKFTFLQRFFG